MRLRDGWNKTVRAAPQQPYGDPLLGNLAFGTNPAGNPPWTDHPGGS